MNYQKEALTKFPEQIQYAIENYVRHNIEIADVENIVLCGLGGSGIAGRIIKSFYQNRSTLPIEVISDYSLPHYVNEHSLVILNSYSGNTEETLSMYMDAVEKQATIIVITTGGLLSDLASENNIQQYNAEPGFQPRMALGYSLTYLALIFSELFSQNAEANLKTLIRHLNDYESFISRAKLGFAELQENTSKKFIIICDNQTYPIGVRFAQQLQENAKAEAFVHELPEANHNVIESYYEKHDSVFLFIDSNLNEKITNRFNFLKELLEKNGQIVSELDFGGYSIEEVYETIYVLDWLSLLVSEKKGVKSDEIPNINALKNFLKDKN